MSSYLRKLIYQFADIGDNENVMIVLYNQQKTTKGGNYDASNLAGKNRSSE